MRFVEPLARLYQYIVPLGAAVRRSIEWRRERPQVRRLQRARADPIDTIEISTEAIFRFAALTFDPRNVTLEEARSLIRMLWRNGAIDRHTEQAFHRALALSQKAVERDDGDARRDLIAVLEQLQNEWRLTRHTNFDIAVALDILRTINLRRRGLPPVT